MAERLRGLGRRQQGYSVMGVPNFGTNRSAGEQAARLKLSADRQLWRNNLPKEVNLRYIKDPATGAYTDTQAIQPSYSGLGAPPSNGDWQSTLSPAERWILEHESGLNPTAKNPTSTAFGIWQGLLSTRQAYAKRFGYDPATVDPIQQLAMFRAYVADRYKTAEAAQQFWMRNHWY